MRVVLDRLILSDLGHAGDPFFLKRHDIQAILYFGDGGMFPEEIKLYHRDALPDGTIDRDQLRDGIDFLRESLRAGRRVLAVGPTGATIVAAYLSEMGFSPAQAIQMISGDEETHLQPDVSSLRNHADELQRRSSASLNHGRL